MARKDQRKPISALLLSLCLSLFAARVNAYEQLWHRVEKDGIVYKIIIDASVELNGRALQDTDFIVNIIQSIKIVNEDTENPVIDPILVREILTAAQSTALFKQGNVFIWDGSLTAISDTLVERSRGNYKYWAPPGWADLILLTTGLDNSSKRRSYYNEVITELIAQRFRYEYSLQSGLLSQGLSTITSLGEFSEAATTLTTAGRVLYRAGGTLEGAETLRSIGKDDVKAVINEVLPIFSTSRSPDSFPYLFFEKVGEAFEVADFGANIGAGILSTVITQARFQALPAKERSVAFQHYLNDMAIFDPEVPNAYSSVMAIWNPEFFAISSNPNELCVKYLRAIRDTLEAGYTNPEVLSNGLTFTQFLVNFSGPAAGWAFAAEGLLDFWSELDYANKAIAAATIERELKNIIESRYEQNVDLAPNTIIDYNDFVFRSALVSIKSHAAYLYYYYTAQSLRINYGDFFDYIKLLAGGKEKHDYHEGRANEIMGVMNSVDLSANRYVSLKGQYEPLFYDGPRPDLSIQTRMERAGPIVRLTQTIKNNGQVETNTHVCVVINGIESQYHHALNSSTISVVPAGQAVVTFDWDVTTVEPGSYEVISLVYSDKYLEGDLSDNRSKLTYQIDLICPVISHELRGVTLKEGQIVQIKLDDFVESTGIDPNSLIWSWHGNSNFVIREIGLHLIEIQAPRGYIGAEKITFILSDSEGHSDSHSIWVECKETSRLSDGRVTPGSGTSGTVFNYEVKYKEPTGKFPEKRFLYINGIPHTMRWSGTPIKDGSIFTFTTFGSAVGGEPNNTYWFEFNAIKSDVLPGPQINVNHDIKLQSCSCEPNQPRPGKDVTFQCQVVNIGTMLEENIIVKFFVNGEPNNSYEIEHLWLGDESQIIKFPWYVPISDYTKDYTIKIQAVSVEGEKNEADNYYVWSFSIVPEPGAISGWVFDQWNNPVEGAIVKVVGSTVEDYGSTTSDPCGYYYLDGLKPTPSPEDYYTLEASKEGLGSQTKTGIVVHSMQTTQSKNFNIMEVQWTQITSGNYNEEDSFWSPSGDKLVFKRTVEGGYYAITVINEDGSGLKYMTGSGKHASEGKRPTWSPDGTKILFIGRTATDSDKVWVTDASGNGSDAHIIVPKSSNSATWSPDSRKIAFSNYATPAHGEIYIYNLDTSLYTQVTPSGEYEDLSWSPDGQSIAYKDNFGRLGIANVSTGETSLIGMNGDHPSWLPDSTGFVFSSAQHDIWLYRIDTKEFIQITFAPEWEVDPTIPLNDPSKIAFTSDKGIASIGTFAVFKMPFSVPALYFTEISASPSIFTPNGDGINDEFNLSYKVNKDAYVTLKIYDSQGTYVRTLLDNTLQTAGQHLSQWDGKNQEGNRESDEVYFDRLDMHDASGVAIPAHGRVGMLKDIRELASGAEYPRWSPSGDKIVYLKEEYDPKFGDQVNHIYICEANDFTNKQLVPTPFKVRPPRPSWSRDGNQIVFPSNSTGNQSQIAKINIDGTGYTEITTYTLGSLIHGDFPSWSPTEDKIVFSGVWNEPTNNFWYITKINADGSGLTKVGSYKGISPAASQAPVWSPDGSKIAYAADRNEDKNFEIYLMNQDGSGEQKITNNPYMDVFPEFTSDGKRLLFGSNRHVGREGSLELWTQPLDGSDKPRCLSKGFGYGMPSLLGDKILVQNNVIELFLSLTKGAIEGRVLEHETLEPIENATVHLYQGVLVGTTLTNEEGGYQFYNLEAGEYVLTAEVEGYIQEPNISVETHPWVVSRDNDIELKREPSVSISEISNGEKIGSVIAVSTRKEKGDVAYVTYQYKRQGEEWHDIETTTYLYPAVFDTREPNLSSGNYQIQAIALDGLGNSDSSPYVISIEIDHTAPTATIINPTNGSKVRGRVNVSASSPDSDTDSIVFQYRRKGNLSWINIGMVDTKEPWVRWWNTKHLEEGEYELRALATDNVGNTDNNPNIVTVTSEFGPESILGDFDNDTDVDFSDLHELISRWLGCDPSVDIAPPGGDDRIDFQDFAELAKRWLEGTTP